MRREMGGGGKGDDKRRQKERGRGGEKRIRGMGKGGGGVEERGGSPGRWIIISVRMWYAFVACMLNSGQTRKRT